MINNLYSFTYTCISKFHTWLPCYDNDPHPRKLSLTYKFFVPKTIYDKTLIQSVYQSSLTFNFRWTQLSLQINFNHLPNFSSFSFEIMYRRKVIKLKIYKIYKRCQKTNHIFKFYIHQLLTNVKLFLL